MTSLELFKSKWQYIILAAILIRIALNWTSDPELQNPDLISALKRARTQSCRAELADIARYLELTQEFHKIIQRSCPLDSQNKDKILKLGCISGNNQHLIKLDNQVQDSSTCYNSCFTFGHSYGAFDNQSRFCYCGDKRENFNVIACDRQDQLELFKVNEGIYYANQTVLQGEGDGQLSSVKIAFLMMLNGRNSRQIKRLIQNIYSETHIYYLHVDKRHDKLLYELHHGLKGWKNVIFAKSRYRTVWGGTSLLPMTIDAISHLSTHTWDFLINLSESDFPIKPLSALESYLKDHSKSSIYLKSHNIKGYKFIKKQGLDRNFHQCEDRVWRIGNRQLPLGIVYSGGSDWYALPRQFCSFILEDLKNPSSLVNSLVQIFYYTLLPIESFFHTLAQNSKFCDKVVDNNLRITNWNRKQGCSKCQHKDIVDWCGCSPLVYRSSDWNKLLQYNQSDSLFFTRKFDPTISSSIINLVEHKLINNFGDVTEDTRYWQNLYRFGDLTNAYQSYDVLEQFGMFCMNQTTEFLFQPKTNLKSVDLFFNHDRFVGFIFYYCSELNQCIKLLVARNTEYHSDNYANNECFKLDGRSLSAIEVNHGFDVGERMFRDYRPLNHLSNVVVYHEWLVNLEGATNNTNRNNQLLFSWINPEGRIRLSQSVKFKDVSKPTRLSLAHRLNISKPIEAGLWSLTIFRHRDECLKHNFLLFNPDSFSQQKITQDDFDKFYSVESICKDEKLDSLWPEVSLCSDQEWNFDH